MTHSSRCPNDRSELLAAIEGRGSDTLRAHVAGCAVCTAEILELRATLEALGEVHESTPSGRVRRGAVSYARAQVRDPKRAWTPWRAPATGLLGVGLAVLFGGLAEARMAPSRPSAQEFLSPEPWSLALGAVWGLALYLYVAPHGSLARKRAIARSLAAAAAFSVLALALPIPTAVQQCVRWLLGTDQLIAGQAMWAYASFVALYAAAASIFAGLVVPVDSRWYEECQKALMFVVLAAPLLFIQTAVVQPNVSMASLLGLGCGAFTGALLVRVVSGREHS